MALSIHRKGAMGAGKVLGQKNGKDLVEILGFLTEINSLPGNYLYAHNVIAVSQVPQ
jgi:hypothetical protein